MLFARWWFRSIPFTLLAHGAGALITLRPLIELAVDDDASQPAPSQSDAPHPDNGFAAASLAADIIVRGLLV